MITPGAGGLCRLDTVTKSKTVQVVQQGYQVGAEDRCFAETFTPWCRNQSGTVFTHRIAAVP
jgi:hypothetical protein